jgi:outer membrane protein OmpA-like peptidoglycan-associated protein
MSKNNSLGEIIQKNILLLTPSSEKINAVQHKNNQDIWLTTHRWKSDEYHSYLVTKDGIKKEAIISKIGKVQEGVTDNTIGTMKSSPDGKKMVSCIKGLNGFELLDFDNATGVLSNAKYFQMEDNARTYSAEFSSDNTKLYVSAGAKYKIYQYNLSDLNQTTSQAISKEDIEKTKTLVATNGYWTGALQLAPDGKIYVSLYGSKYLGIINQPNLVGVACNYIENGIDLKGGIGQLGLPTFVQTYFDDSENLRKIVADRPIQMGKVFTKPILFETDKFVIRPQYFKDLDDLVLYLTASKATFVDILGHTDSEGEDDKNLILSKNRANAVVQYLVSKGISSNRIKGTGFGETLPVATNNTSEGKTLNRRIEFLIYK